MIKAQPFTAQVAKFQVKSYCAPSFNPLKCLDLTQFCFNELKQAVIAYLF